LAESHRVFRRFVGRAIATPEDPAPRIRGPSRSLRSVSSNDRQPDRFQPPSRPVRRRPASQIPAPVGRSPPRPAGCCLSFRAQPGCRVGTMVRGVVLVVLAGGVLAACGGGGVQQHLKTVRSVSEAQAASSVQRVTANVPARGLALKLARATARQLGQHACQRRISAVYCRSAHGWTCTTSWRGGGFATFTLTRPLLVC
jgi:hypothetical protein